MTPEETRTYVKNQLHSMGLPIVEANGFLAVKRLKSHPAYVAAEKIGAYAPQPEQIDVTHLMTQNERQFYIPALDETLGIYRMAAMGETFKRNTYGTVEPVEPVFVDADELDLILVPGVAFDNEGRRLGEDLDFYDDLLKFYNAPVIGLAIDAQRLKDLPVPDDAPRMDVVITESYCIETEK
ncbi:5-formyltetrahydrofolate cyclo-ligase [Pontiella agarivorans]|uniref:5-formyltetrahydrofolate cyclo-ligase n=1 Tax=Pontiella agarivorans TaxID=3038953 RepID=A0ABU5MTC3_9BACT|nr:5-formyltetrahydrofolate cyclo-ligase [Pontiella agarivorans]MDZ8117447.1 5-formyltetrahydrofolate cyclo-ligase [Pontiella agarivorans]